MNIPTLRDTWKLLSALIDLLVLKKTYNSSSWRLLTFDPQGLEVGRTSSAGYPLKWKSTEICMDFRIKQAPVTVNVGYNRYLKICLILVNWKLSFHNNQCPITSVSSTFKKTAENFAGVEGAAKPPTGLRDSFPIGVRGERLGF